MEQEALPSLSPTSLHVAAIVSGTWNLWYPPPKAFPSVLLVLTVGTREEGTAPSEFH